MNKHDHLLAKPMLRNALVHREASYYHTFAIGRALGYRKPQEGPGVWLARIGHGYKLYRHKTFAQADDFQAANGRDVLNFQQALARAREWCRNPAQSQFAPDPRKVGQTSELIACPCGPVYTVGHALAEYVEWKRTFGAESTFYCLLPVLNTYVYPRLGTIAAADLTAKDIWELMDHVITTPTGAYMRRWGNEFNPARMNAETRRRRRNTANHVLSILKGALNLAWEQDKIEDDRAWRRVPSFKGTRRTRVDILTRSECRDLITACDPGIRTIVLGLLYTGCRLQELLNMRAEDVSRVRKAVFVNQAKHYKSRHIALPKEGYRFFKLLSFRKERKSLLFLRPGGLPWSRYLLDKGRRRAFARANLPTGLVYHTLRHTYASLRLQEGVSPVAVARQMGHKDVRTVMEYYAHCTDDFIDREIRKRFISFIDSDHTLYELIESDREAETIADVERRNIQAASSQRTA